VNVSLLDRAFEVLIAQLPLDARTSSYPVKNSLIFLKPCAQTTVEADTKTTTAMDNATLRIPLTSRIYVVMRGGANHIRKTQ
jgi:hypothetical protein